MKIMNGPYVTVFAACARAHVVYFRKTHPCRKDFAIAAFAVAFPFNAFDMTTRFFALSVAVQWEWVCSGTEGGPKDVRVC